MNRDFMQLRTFVLLGVSAFGAVLHAEVQGEGIRDTTHMSEVMVTSTRGTTDIRNRSLIVTSIGNEKLEENFRSSVLPTVVEQTPGFFATSRGILGNGVNTGAGELSLRGVGGGARLLVMIDGQPQYAGLMGHPMTDMYQTMMAERVEVYRGPVSMYYGSNAMGGAVNIITRQMNQEGSKTSVRLQGGSYGTAQAEAVSRYRRGDFSGVAGAQYQRTDGHRADSRFKQFGGFVRLGYEFSENWKAVANANVTRFSSSNPGPSYAPLLDNDAWITRGLVDASLTNKYRSTEGSLRAYYDFGHHKIDDGYGASASPRTYHYTADDYMTGVAWHQSAHFFQGNTVTVGLDWQHLGGSAWNQDKQTGNRTYLTKDAKGNLQRSQHVDNVGTYVDFRQDVFKWLTVDAGLRVDWHSVVGAELVPQGSLAVRPTHHAEVKAIVSKGFRNPVIRDMYMFPPANADLLPERMMNYELAYTQTIASNLRLGANLFYIKGENLINKIFVNGRPRNVNTGDFQNWGFELSADYRVGKHWSLNANYSYLDMQTPIVGAPKSKLYVGVNYRSERWKVATGLQNISGLYIATASAAGQQASNGTKENYTLLNTTVSYKVCPLLTIFAKGENLLAQQYQTYDGFYMPKATFMGGVALDF